jgi:hypothetical protein
MFGPAGMSPSDDHTTRTQVAETQKKIELLRAEIVELKKNVEQQKILRGL